MKNLYFKLLGITCFIFLGINHSAHAQIGIGTTAPEGALHLNTDSEGFVIPAVALTARNLSGPVLNPNGAPLVEGTVVYNTSKTKLANNNVFPGIYAWSGTQWNPQFKMEDYKQFLQTGGCQRTTIKQQYSTPSPNNADNVSGLTNRIFTPKYSGMYKVEVKTNFAAGKVRNFAGSEDNISLATMEGAFFFRISGSGVNINPSSGTFDYKKGWMYTHSYGALNTMETPSIESHTVPHFEGVVHYLHLLAGENYTFSLTNCTITGDQFFVNNGDTGDGQGHIGHDQPCSVEFTFIGD
tara:strand:- start:230 stop:1117 length:888 start_codon:yes stop_codon:yes gene_type:complete